MNIAASLRTPARLLVALILTLALLASAALTALPARAASLTGSATSLTWGFYEGWRTYIANGGSTVTSDGATDNGSGYAFSAASASLDPATGAGQAAFDGAVTWLKPAHGINITISDPRVEFAGGTGSIYWTVGGTEVLGATIGAVGLGAPVASGATSTLSVTGKSVYFTAAGGAVFGQYSTTTQMDDFSFSISYATPATPTTVTLSSRTAAVVTGGGVALSASVSAGIAGSVQFLDGATPLATVAVASNAASYIAVAASGGAHSYTAVFTPTDAATFSPSTSAPVVVTASPLPAALVGNVSGATLDWGFSHYANFAATAGTAASGWPVSASGGPELLSPTGSASLGFRLTGGTGSVSTITGVGSISYPGSVTYVANGANAAQFTLSGFVLNVVSPTEGTLTGYVSTKATSAATAVVGATPVTMATFDITSLSATAGTFTLQSADPDYLGTVPAGTYSGTYANAWPASFIAAIDSTQRSYFYQSGTTQGNLNKPPLPISASFTATTPTTTALDVSSTSVVAGGGVRLRTVLTSNVAGSVEFFDGATSLGTVAAATAQGATTATYLATAAAGSHGYRAVFTPTIASYGQSTSETVTVTTTTQAAPLVGNVTGASLSWGVSNYAAFGGTVATAASGWPVVTEGGPELLSPVTVANGTASQGFRLTGGTGSADPASGIGAISYPGSVTYSPYGPDQPSFRLTGFVLTTSSATEGSLTAYLSTKSNAAATVWAGPAPVTVATFDTNSLTGTAGVFALQSAAPDYTSTVAAGAYSPGFSSAYPASFIQAMDPVFRSFFYQTGTTQGNLNKPPLALSASFTASTPTTSVLSTTSTSVVAGGSIQLRTTVPAGVAGSVEFFEGVTSLGSAAVVSASAAVRVPAVTAGSHTYSSVFTPTSSAQYGSSTSNSVSVTTTTQFAPLSGNVTGAELEWGFSAYSAFGSSVGTAASGWPITVAGGPVALSPVGTTSQGFRLTGGNGQVDPITGLGGISFPGTVTYSPYGGSAGAFTLSGFVLSMTSATEGTLTGYLTTTSSPGQSSAIGLSPVTFATFDIASLVGTAGDFELQSAAPDYAGTVSAGHYAPLYNYTSAWPTSFVSAMENGFRPFFYQSGATPNSQGNLNKTPLPLSATFHADAAATSVSLTASQTAGLLPGDAVTVTANVTPGAAAGTVTVTVDGTQVGTGPAGTPLVVSTGALAVGTHTVVATFTPANTAAYQASADDLVLTVDAPAAVPAGSLTWAVYSPFNAYVTGFAAGSITTSNGASGAFRFEQSTGATYDATTGLGSSSYRGAVRYLGHDGALDLTLSNPVVRITSTAAATLYVTVGGAQVAFASLNLGAVTATTNSGAVTATTNSGAVTYAGVPATLLAAGAAFFGGNYPIGTAIAPVSFTIGSASTANPAAASIAAAEKWVAPATPPATTGLTVEGEAIEGAEITVSGTGFAPNEKDIHVIIYSSPLELGTVTADSTGLATWTGELPAGLTGQHTLTLQGSVSRGVVLDIQAAPVSTTAIAGCPVDDATITWGFKESFRSYISGSIANGEWTVADGATYETPNFGWADGTGGYDLGTSKGELAFTGSIDFTGHSGVLNTLVANPVIVFEDADTAVLKLDISGTTQEGDPVAQTGVEFVELDLSAATVEIAEDGTVTITDAPTTLTETGAAAFGTYEPGEAFDPITVVFTTGADCALPAEDEAATATPIAATDDTDLSWLFWLIPVLLLIIAAAVVVIVRRRRVTA